MTGYAGKILRLNLTDRTITTIATSDYEQWIGGHGMGSAIFFDLVKDKTVDGFSPANVMTIMTSPLSGTLAPGASGRTEVQTIGVQSYPIGWYTRSNFGGRFSAMLKYAGWDGIVIEGKANTPVWIDIRDENVQIRECSELSLWGKDTGDCQQTIWEYIAGSEEYGSWIEPNNAGKGKTTQRPAVLTIGPAGENLSRLACLIHDAGNTASQGGFGAVWGCKNLKAISVIGTGSIIVHDPKALMAVRLLQQENYAFDINNLEGTKNFPTTEFCSPPVPLVFWERPKNHGPQACIGCHSACRARYDSGLGNEAKGVLTNFYQEANTVEIQYTACDLLNKYGLNAYEIIPGLAFIRTLNQAGILGQGMQIDCPLNFDDYGSMEFIEQFIKMLSYRDDGHGNKSDFGNDIAEGFFRAADAWGILEWSLENGLLPFSCWGLPDHMDYRAQLEWGYGTILGDRDVNEHDFDNLHQIPKKASKYGVPLEVTAEEAATIYADKMAPYAGERHMLDYSTGNMYSEHIAKLVAWHRHYTRFWKQSLLYCDFRWPDFVNINAPNKIGSSGEAEPKFFNAVTGKNFTFLDGMELGRKIWNLDHAIWTLQGRHRDMVQFAKYIYSVPSEAEYLLPGLSQGEWDYINVAGRYIDKEKFEDFKTTFYQLEGWDPATGYPTRSTLEGLDLGYVADELEKNGKIGNE